MMFDYKKRMDAALNTVRDWEGMFPVVDAIAFGAMMEYQDRNDIHGNIIECGVYKGKSAAFLAHHMRDDEELVLIDINRHKEVEKIQNLHSSTRYEIAWSKDFFKKNLNKLSGKFRFLHNDGSHTYEDTINDLKAFTKLGGSNCIIAVDDYTNPYFPQVPIAVAHFLKKYRRHFAAFSIGGNKMYICRQRHAVQMQVFVIERLREIFAQHNIAVTFSKTDHNDLFSVVSFIAGGAAPGEFYGPALYRKHYEFLLNQN